MDACQLSVNTAGCFYHPLGDQTPIDCRYSESIATVDLPDKQMLVVNGTHVVKLGRITDPRGVEIHNVSNQGTQVQPDDEERAEMSRKTLYVGFDEQQAPPIELPPYIPGDQIRQFGGSQFLWLAKGARLVLSSPPGVNVLVRLVIFPGASDG